MRFTFLFSCICFVIVKVKCAPEPINATRASEGFTGNGTLISLRRVSASDAGSAEGVPTGRTFIRPVSSPNDKAQRESQAPTESEERYIAPIEPSVKDDISDDEVTNGKFTAVPGVDEHGRWFFDWFWGYDQPEYPPPLVPRPAPVYPHPYPPDVPLEVCTEMHNPITLDVYEECYPLD